LAPTTALTRKKNVKFEAFTILATLASVMAAVLAAYQFFPGVQVNKSERDQAAYSLSGNVH